jgi:Flp pilus assembly protein TadG
MQYQSFWKDERGTSLAEYAIISIFFFMLIFGVIEFGRFLYIHNALNDAARRGARYAVVHLADVDTDGLPHVSTCVQNVVKYGETHINPTTCQPLAGSPVLINNISSASIQVTYKGADLDNNPTSPNPYGTNLGTVTVTITGYVFQINIPLFRRGVGMQSYSTTLPAESAGYKPEDI